MTILPAAIGSFLLVNLACACIALGVGFGAGVWFLGARLAKPTEQRARKKRPNKKAIAARRAAERASMATIRVADLAQGVASDVGDHAAKMQAISDDLAGLDREASGSSAAVFLAMDKIMAANSELQQRLVAAEQQLAAQSAEIKAHESEARTDSLTGLSNRRAFDDELKRRLNEFERKGTPLTLILLDIDFFKKFNDTHGHQVGDEVLRTVAKTLRGQARDMDLPCRYGGEEFGVILPATDGQGACVVAERIRKAVEDSLTNCEGKSLKVTCSLGLSPVQTGDDAAKIIRRADDALYFSKKAGRNCGHWTNGECFLPVWDPKAIPMFAAESELEFVEPDDDADPQPRTTFIHKLKRRVTESHRFGVPLSVMLLTIEDYESVLQNHGKAIARRILDAAQPAFEKALREMDVLARMENGEFIVMLPGKTHGEAGQIVKRMRITLANCMVPLKDGEFNVRFRHGVVELQPNEMAQALLFRARQALLPPDASRMPVKRQTRTGRPQ